MGKASLTVTDQGQTMAEATPRCTASVIASERPGMGVRGISTADRLKVMSGFLTHVILIALNPGIHSADGAARVSRNTPDTYPPTIAASITTVARTRPEEDALLTFTWGCGGNRVWLWW